MLRFSCEVRKQPGPEGGDEGGSEPVRRSVSLVFAPIPVGPGVGRRDRYLQALEWGGGIHIIFASDVTTSWTLFFPTILFL